MPPPYTQDDKDDGINTTCVVCGRQIHAGKYPPVCDDNNSNCLFEWNIETGFNRFANGIKEIKKEVQPT